MRAVSVDAVFVRRTVAGDSLRARDEVRDLRAHANLLYELVHRDLTVRYKRSFFGFFWTMIHPLLLMLIFVAVFSGLFKHQTPHYETYFLSAYIAWNFFSQTTTNAMAGLAWNGPLMKRVRVPRSIFTLSAALSGIVNLALSLVVLFVIMLAVRAPLHFSLVALPISLLIVGIFTFGVSLALTAASVFFADVREMYQAGLPALLYLTPAIYPIEIVPLQYRWLIEMNPLTFLVEIVRDPIYYGRIPSPHTFGVAFAFALAALIGGWMIFRRLAPWFDSRL
ncbi:MAG: lipopolysaccharide transport system permease protein [Acidobacteriota bacterium]|jgi:ABC-type polysaccharide/polyol phosphate export permease|nr:lipopolysaccharide transport system permease protein [Acidobacteriota bacterium]